MSDMSAYTQQASMNAVTDERATTRIRQRAQKHAAEINEMAANVEQLANVLFGHLPQPPDAPKAGMMGSQIEPIKPQLDAIDSAQFMIDEALESLRRQLARLGTL